MLLLTTMRKFSSINMITEYLYSLEALKEGDNVPLNAPEQTPNYLTILWHPGVSPHQLNLKVNAICTLHWNLSVEKGLVHNAHIYIAAIQCHFIKVQFPSNLQAQTYCIPHITFCFSPSCSNWTVSCKQFPLWLTYVTTFNRCQGLTWCYDLPLVFLSFLYDNLSVHALPHHDLPCAFSLLPWIATYLYCAESSSFT